MTPAPGPSASLRVLPLGGLGEIGGNCLVLEQQTGSGLDRLVIDCGVSFSVDDSGVDLYHPRFDYLLERPEALRGVVLTHGHEDHIGGLGYLVDALGPALRRAGRKLEVWGPPYALVLVRSRLDEHAGLVDLVALRPSRPRQRLRVGSFVVEPVRVAHSMLDCTALAIDTAVGKVVHSGDFKLDDAPSDGQCTDEQRFEELGDAGVRLLLSDSTNVLEPGTSASEQRPARALAAMALSAEHRLVVGLFASNLHRVKAIAEATQAAGRRLCLLGRSLGTHVAAGREVGLLRLPSDLLVSPAQAARMDRAAVVYAVTGSQAEGRAALRRLASDEHPDLRLEPGDAVVLSSRVIPGNERSVQVMVSDLLRLGVRVTTRKIDAEVHASGHAYQAEQRQLIELVRPDAFIPVHGTSLHLQRHASLARERGVGQVLVLHDGEIVQLSKTGIGMLAPVTAGRVARSGSVVLDEPVLQERRALARGGLLVVVVRTAWGGAEAGATARAWGLPDADRLCDEAASAARGAMVAAPGAGEQQLGDAERVRRAVRRRLGKRLGFRPKVEVIMVGA